MDFPYILANLWISGFSGLASYILFYNRFRRIYTRRSPFKMSKYTLVFMVIQAAQLFYLLASDQFGTGFFSEGAQKLFGQIIPVSGFYVSIFLKELGYEQSYTGALMVLMERFPDVEQNRLEALLNGLIDRLANGGVGAGEMHVAEELVLANAVAA